MVVRQMLVGSCAGLGISPRLIEPIIKGLVMEIILILLTRISRVSEVVQTLCICLLLVVIMSVIVHGEDGVASRDHILCTRR